MNRIYRRIFICSLVFSLVVCMYTRHQDGPNFRFLNSKLLYSLPLEFNDGRNSIEFQTCLLSTSQVVEILKKYPEECPESGQNSEPPKYAVITFKDRDGRSFGKFKVYFSCFGYPLVLDMDLTSRMNNPYNQILPIPYHSYGNEEPCKVNIRWKNLWGM